MSSPFSDILRTAIDRTPHAVGGAFAASDGEMVDFVAGMDPTDFAILTAHYGVLLGHIQSAFRTWHFGEAELLMFSNETMEVLVRPVVGGYFALLAIRQPAPLGTAIDALDEAALGLRREMRW